MPHDHDRFVPVLNTALRTLQHDAPSIVLAVKLPCGHVVTAFYGSAEDVALCLMNLQAAYFEKNCANLSKDVEAE